jgi:hypothetical protein
MELSKRWADPDLMKILRWGKHLRRVIREKEGLRGRLLLWVEDNGQIPVSVARVGPVSNDEVSDWFSVVNSSLKAQY